ncbi:MAG: SDR family oxidoreductase [Rubrivivax sp.]
MTVVVGAGYGIGEAVARSRAQHGEAVFVVDIHAPTGEAVAASIRSTGLDATFLRADAGDRQSVRAMIGSVLDSRGRLDSLVLPAAAPPFEQREGLTREQALAYEVERALRTISINIEGTIEAIEAASPALKESSRGRVVTFASRVLLGGLPYIYTVSKCAVAAFTRSFALRLAPSGVTVNAVCPGFTETRRTTVLNPHDLGAMAQKTPLGRNATPADLAASVDFLLSEGAGFITGQCLFVCGGRSLVGDAHRMAYPSGVRRSAN